jgi:lysophospholipase L1-like esterase
MFGSFMFVVLFVGLESVIRIGAYFVYQRSPYFLYYGLRDLAAEDNPDGHSVSFKGYSKFQPNRLVHQYGMFAKPTPIQINSHGLRGPEFSAGKPLDVFRIVCMGESSTFGFFDRDDFTYPVLLGQLLAKDGTMPGKRIETVNAGIPHANSDNILAMLKGELLGYSPDVLTLYAGFNDSAFVMDETFLQATMRWLHAHLATYVAVKRVITAAGGPELHSRWTGYLSDMSAESVGRQVDLHVARYERNVREMVRLATEHGSRFIFIKQPVVFDFERPDSDWRTMTFDARVARARARVSSGQPVPGIEANLVVHAALMDTLERLSRQLKVPVVDNAAIMDRHPEYFASYVHITEAGNREIAEALRQAVKSLY